ncbi:multiple epidermal growth factor-like domains protein 10 [Magallana gigas]|uniref:multiple epidermal growth factor-like domains protein 10 n=1 Tax=Magallana gigas TaxID=29159 RepID=UPI003340ADBB
MFIKMLSIIWTLMTFIVTRGYDDLSANKVARQYKTHIGCQSCVANNAVDRDIQTCARMEDIGTSAPNRSTWWYVDLGSTYNVVNIRIQFKDYKGYTMRQRGRFAGFSLYVSNTTNRHMGQLCYKDGPQLPPLDFHTNCITHGRYVIFYNERIPGTTYPIGYVESPVFTELCEVTVTGCSSSGVYGENCDKVCPDNCQERRCDIINGTCLNCKPGWLGEHCDKACPAGQFGPQCESKCVGHCKYSVGCNHTTGLCDNGCDDGWTGSNCNKECPLGNHGPDCVYKCSAKCLGDVACNRKTGKCDTGCDIGYTGELCETVLTGCEIGTFAKGCSNQCSGHCLNNGPCNSTTWHCDSGCAPGYKEPFCNNTDLESNALMKSCNEPSYIAGISVLVIICIALGSVCLFLMWKHYRLVKKMHSLQYISVIRTSTQDNNADDCQQYEELRISENGYHNIEFRH